MYVVLEICTILVQLSYYANQKWQRSTVLVLCGDWLVPCLFTYISRQEGFFAQITFMQPNGELSQTRFTPLWVQMKSACVG